MKDLTETIKLLAINEIRELNFCMQGTVVGIDKLKDGFIDVSPLISKHVPSIGYVEYPIVYDVPVCAISTNNSSIHIPIQQGDDVLLIFTQNDTSSYIEGNRDYHNPPSNSLLSLGNAKAIVGINTYQDSPFNPNNYKNEFDEKSLNIVHNKNTENEITLSLKEDGVFKIKTSNKVEVESPEIDAKNSLIKTENDILIKNISLYQFITKHTHNGVMSGQSTTLPPNPV